MGSLPDHTPGPHPPCSAWRVWSGNIWCRLRCRLPTPGACGVGGWVNSYGSGAGAGQKFQPPQSSGVLETPGHGIFQFLTHIAFV